MIKYKYLYTDYLREMDQKRKELAKSLEVKEDKNTREIGFLEDDLRKTNIAYIAVGAVFSVLLGPFYAFASEYLELYSILIYLSVALFGLFIVFLVKCNIKSRLKKLQKENNSKEQELEKAIYKEKSEKLYSIVLFIICINENYTYLNSCNELILKEKWEEIVENRKNIINLSMNYKPTLDKYEQYFIEWMQRYEKIDLENK